MIKFLKRSKPSWSDAIGFTLRTREDLLEDIKRLERENRELHRKIDYIGHAVIPNYSATLREGSSDG